MSCLSIINSTKIMQWTKECKCNSGKTNFDTIEFGTNPSRIEIVCSKCHGVICWWPISTEQVALSDEQRTNDESVTMPARIND